MFLLVGTVIENVLKRRIRTPIQWVAWALSLGVKQPGCESDHLPPSNAKVKECMELYLHSPNMSS
jgi:hypothetical protein